MDALLRQWNDIYFNGQLPPIVLSILDGLELSHQHPHVQAVVERHFRFMNRAGIPASCYSDEVARNLCVVLPNIAPNAWGGIIPPITFRGRHRTIDAYIRRNTWQKPCQGRKFLDLGCGFPPLTTVETAEELSDWEIIGADPGIPHYIVYNAEGDYASFTEAGELRHLAGRNRERSDRYHQDMETAKLYFTGLLRQCLQGGSSSAPGELSQTSNNDIRLETDPISAYEDAHTTFQRGGIGELDIREVDVIRCFNVFIYFDRDFRNHAMPWFTEILGEGGLLLCGGNAPDTSQCKFTVYQKEATMLSTKEFAFSIDNVRSCGFVSALAYHENDYESTLLTTAVGVIRSNAEYRRDFDARLDTLFLEYGSYARDESGNLMSIRSEMSTTERDEHKQAVFKRLDHEGYVEGAADVLRQAGYDAWRNNIGYVSVAPIGIDA
jgi:hypothetical protein